MQKRFGRDRSPETFAQGGLDPLCLRQPRGKSVECFSWYLHPQRHIGAQTSPHGNLRARIKLRSGNAMNLTRSRASTREAPRSAGGAPDPRPARPAP